MGSRQSIQPQTEQWRDQQWENLPYYPQTFGRTATLRNIRTGALVDEYQLTWASEQDFQFYLKSLNWRSKRRNPGPIVNSIAIKRFGKNGICSSRWGANVYIEHVGVRLSQIQDISISDSLYILLEALLGYEQLYSHAGYFRVQEEQVCMQRGGRIKVWVNGNLAKNYPQLDPQSECLRRDETHMVRQLVDVVESNTDPDEIPQQSLSSFLQEIRRQEGCQVGFERAQVAVLDYAKSNQIEISNRLSVALDLYDMTQTRFTVNSIITNERHYQRKTVKQIVQGPQLQSYHSSPNLHHTASLTIYPSSSDSYHPQQSAYNPFQPQPQTTSMPQHHQIQGQVPQHAAYPTNSYTRQPVVQQPEDSWEKYPRNSRPTTNTRTHLANLQETSEHHSMNIDQSNERSLGGSQRGPYSVNNPRGKEWIRYSQNIEDNYTQYQFNSFKFNRDTFGLAPHRRLMKESTSSYHVPSSNNSSRSPGRRSRRSYRSSRMESGKGSSQKSEVIMGKWQVENNRNRYYVGVGDYSCLDPQIAADIAKYLG